MSISIISSGINVVGATTNDVTGITVSGTNRILYGFLTRDSTVFSGDPTCVWDAAGANESATLFQTLTGTSRALALFRLVAPTVGSSKIVTFGNFNTIDTVAGVIVLDGVDQTTPDDTPVTDSNTTGTSDTNTVTSASGDLVLSAVAINNQNTAGIDGGAAELQAAGNGGIGMGLLTNAGAASVNCDWTWTSNSDWRHAAFNVNAAPVAGGGPSLLPLMGVGMIRVAALSQLTTPMSRRKLFQVLAALGMPKCK